MTDILADRIAQAIGDPGSILPRNQHHTAHSGSQPAESITRWSTRAVVAVLADALAVEPCHITGMHTPEHHTRFLCSEQKAAKFDALLAGLGLSPEDLPRRLHENCGWCHRVPSQEKYRQQLRETYRWAGVEIPAALAELAPDAPRPGDTDLVLAHVTDEWLHWPNVFSEIEAAESLGGDRIGHAFRDLLASGLIEEQRTGPGSPDIRRAQSASALRADEAAELADDELGSGDAGWRYGWTTTAHAGGDR